MLGWLAVATMLAIVVLGSSASRIWAASVDPIPLSGAHPTCAELAATYGGGQTWLELKLEGDDLANGTHTVGTLTVTITNLTGTSFDWSSNFGVDAVLVKAGEKAHNLYVYAPTAASTESFGDTGLQSQDVSGNGISHISFCYDLSNPPSNPPSEAASNPPSEAASNPPSEAASNPPSEAASGGVEEETGTPGSQVTPPNTATDIGSGGTSDGWRIPVLGLALLVGSILLLTPRRTIKRRR